MKKSLLAAGLLVVSVFVSFAQNGKKVSLIVSGCDENEKICDTQHVYRYNFLDGG